MAPGDDPTRRVSRTSYRDVSPRPLAGRRLYRRPAGGALRVTANPVRGGTAARQARAGGMFWFSRKRLVGSYRRLISASRFQVASGYAS